MTAMLLLAAVGLTGVTWVAAPVLRMRRDQMRNRHVVRTSVDVPLGHVQLGTSGRPDRVSGWTGGPVVGARASEELLLRARHEGLALRRSLEDAVLRSWAPDAVSAWEARVERLIGHNLERSPDHRPGGPIVGSTGWGERYEAGAQASWLGLRIDRRLAALTEAIEMVNTDP